VAINIPIITSFSDSGLAAANKKLSMFGKQFPGIGLAIAGVTAAVGALGVAAFSAVQKASDLNEAVSKAGVIFGQSSKQVEEFARTANRSLGLANTTALNAASTFATFGKAAGLAGRDLVEFSTDFVTLASDLASFNNTSVDQAINAIGAALRGESEPLRAYGVLLNDATLKAEALEMGIYSGSGALGQQAKILAAQRVILKQTGDAQGDFSRTSGGLANQQKILSATLENVQTNLGTALLPLFTKVVRFFNEKVTPAIEQVADAFGEQGLVFGIQVALNKMGEAGPIIVRVFKGIASAIANTVNVVYKLVKALQAVYYFSIGQFTKGIDATKAAFDNLIDVDKLNKNFDSFIAGISTVGERTNTAADYVDRMAERTAMLGRGAKDTAGELAGMGDGAGKASKKVNELYDTIRDKLTDALDDAKKQLQSAQDDFTDFGNSVAEGIKTAFSFSDAKDAGEETGGGFLAGLGEQVEGVKQYATNVDLLLQRGLSQQALQEVLNAGAEAGASIAAELVAGGQEAITGPGGVNALVATVQQVADKLGLDSASRFYQAGVDQGKALVAGLESVLAKYEKILANPNLSTKRLTNLLDKAQTDIAFTQITAGQAVAAPAPTKASIANVNQAKANKGGTNNYTVNVQGGLATSAEIGRVVTNAQKAFARQNGPLDIPVVGFR
jgi:hypothetical protein